MRIFSYLPNPRVWKSQIVADLCGIELEVVGDKAANLPNWLWDFDARPLQQSEKTAASPFAREGKRGFKTTLYKTDQFLVSQPFATVPCAFSSDGDIGIFESNSIMRAVARAGGNKLYGGDDHWMTSRIDSFLDAALVFAREAQVYLLEMNSPTEATHARMTAAYHFYLDGLEQALTHHDFIAGDTMTIADIGFVCDFSQFLREGHYDKQLGDAGLSRISHEGASGHPRVFAHLIAMSEQEVVARHLGTYLNWYREENGL